MEVVADDRQVVGVAGVEGFLHRGGGVHDVGAALVHVVALPGRAAADLCQGQGGHVVRGDAGAAVVGDLDAAAEFAGCVGIAVEGRTLARGGLAAQVGADGVVVAQRGEEVVPAVVACPARVGVVPGGFGVARVEREELVGGQVCHAPRRGGPQSRGDPGVLGHVLEAAQVFGLVVELVLDLDGDDRSAPGVVQPVQFGADARVVGLDEFEVGGVVGAGPGTGVLYPLGEPAVAGLAVGPGADPHDGVQSALGDHLQEGPEVPVAVEAEVSAVLFVVVPEEVGGDDVDAAGAHAQQLLAPAVTGVSGEVDLAHDREPRAVTAHEMGAGGVDPVRPLGLTHPEMAVQRRCGRAQGQGVHDRPPGSAPGPGRSGRRCRHSTTAR